MSNGSLKCSAVLNETNNCQVIFDSFLVLELTDPGYGEVHMLTVACFLIQHGRLSDEGLAWIAQKITVEPGRRCLPRSDPPPGDSRDRPGQAYLEGEPPTRRASPAQARLVVDHRGRCRGWAGRIIPGCRSLPRTGHPMGASHPSVDEASPSRITKLRFSICLTDKLVRWYYEMSLSRNS